MVMTSANGLGGTLSYFSFQPVHHDWCNKGRGMCYPVCWILHIKEPLLLIGKSSTCGGIGFALSLSEWFIPYVWRHITADKNALTASLKKYEAVTYTINAGWCTEMIILLLLGKSIPWNGTRGFLFINWIVLNRHCHILFNCKMKCVECVVKIFVSK